MVLSDLPFERSRLIHSRYNLLRRPGSAPVPREEEQKNQQSKEYAAFLKEQERKVGPDGFLDSNKFSHTFSVKKDRDRYKALSERAQPTVVRLSVQYDLDKKDHDKRMKVIEDHMWQHKQEERELKRVEGDIIKNQRSVRHVLRDYENVISKKRMAEEKKLSTALDKYTVLKRDHVHQSHQLTKSRTMQNYAYEHDKKDKGRKVEVKKSDLSRTYKTKMSEMELKQIELARMYQDYETKLRTKEQEQHKLKQELAELSIALNMEAQKGRQQVFDSTRDKKKETTGRIMEDLNAKMTVDNKIAKSDGDTKQAEMTKRKLDADLVLTKSHIAIKQRDEQRHLADTQSKLDGNSTTQRQLNEAALYAEMDLKTKQMQQNIESHNKRRVTQLTSHMRQKKVTEEAKQQVWEARFKKRFDEKNRMEHEDSLKFFQKLVNKGEDMEQNLYSKVRNSEYARQKQEQSVRHLQQQLQEAKRKNAIKVKQEIAFCNKKEMELEQKLIREKAELDKVHAQREESYVKLQNHRQHLNSDKHNLEEHEREHYRLLRISSQSEAMLESMDA